MNVERCHRHHLVPKHLGGDNSEDNLTPPISIELHAAFHKQLYELFGNQFDYIAWKALDGRIGSEEARIMACKEGQRKSEKYKQTRTGKYFKPTFESQSKGGKIAGKLLVDWQKENKELFSSNCRERAYHMHEGNKIVHHYLGQTFESKQALQKEHNMKNAEFYRNLNNGLITREKPNREIAHREHK